MHGGIDRAGGDTGADAVEAAVAVVLGTTVVAWRLLSRVATPARGAATALLSAVVGPAASGPTAERGRALRAQGTRVAALALQQVTRQVLGIVLPALDLTERVLTHVDLDRIASGLDLDAAVARVDLDAAVARVDLDALVDRLDLDAVVARVDLAAIVDRIDVEAVASRIDLDRLAEGLDLQAIVDRLDLDAAAARLDADLVVARVDLDAIVRRIDVIGIAQSVIDAIDLPEIVRESTGALSSDAVRAVRAEGRRADDRVAGLVDRLLRRSTVPAPVMP
ncbi:MAG: hypothetical protein QOH17_1221 [Pseudonocardiales bacterium]|nr:hypothetical protein [Pseudonocardiales bacterium]